MPDGLEACWNDHPVVPPRRRRLPNPVAAPPRAPEPPKRTAFELDVQWAESLVRDADALIKEVDAVMTPQWVPGPDTNTLGVKLSRANTKLKQARTLYTNRIGQAPDPELLKSRVAAIAKSLDEVQLRFDRLGGRTQSHR